jgi:hypothetical protein
MTDERRAEGDDPRLSVLARLGKRREEIIAKDTITLRVPRWSEPDIWVEYKPVSHTLIKRALSAVDRAKGRDKAEAEVDANADVLIAGCQRVYAKLEGEDDEFSLRPDDPRGEYTTFDGDLADKLDVADRRARAVVRALFLTDGDIIATAERLTEFSGYRINKADEEALGE